MSQAGAQRNVQGRNAKILKIVIPANGSPVAIRSLIASHARMSSRDINNITSVRIYAKDETGAARLAFLFGDDDADMNGYAAADKSWYVAATHAEGLFVEGVAAAVPAIIEVLVG